MGGGPEPSARRWASRWAPRWAPPSAPRSAGCRATGQATSWWPPCARRRQTDTPCPRHCASVVPCASGRARRAARSTTRARPPSAVRISPSRPAPPALHTLGVPAMIPGPWPIWRHIWRTIRRTRHRSGSGMRRPRPPRLPRPPRPPGRGRPRTRLRGRLRGRLPRQRGRNI